MHEEPGRGDVTRAGVTDPEEGARGPDDPATAPDAGPDAAGDTVGDAAGEAAEVAVLRDRLHRALADLDNQRKRHARELRRERDVAAADVAAAWLPVLDNLDLALSYADADPATIVEGVRAVREQALSVLAKLGFPRDDDVGMPFDPARHEVVDVEEGTEAAPGTVLRVLRPGYGDPERQLRPGAVTVAGGQG